MTASEPRRWRERLSQSRTNLALFALTLALTVLSDFTIAIVVSSSIGLALRLRRRNLPPIDWTTPER